MNFIIVNPDVFEMIGVAGFALYVINYSLLTLRFMDGHSLSYFILNLLAAASVLVGLTVSFNLASAMIQLFWVAMSSLGIVLRLTRPTPALA
ncbi:MAG: hypothetical protein P8Q26_03075 [Ascidiaceihabitans sp.]|nr:hypothetical protein [Ascidiaceihabitans sp.]